MTHRSVTNTESSEHQHPTRSHEGEHKLPTEETVKRSTRCDGSRHSILENLGHTQSGGDDGGDVGCEELSSSNPLARRYTKYLETVRVSIVYYVVQTSITP